MGRSRSQLSASALRSDTVSRVGRRGEFVRPLKLVAFIAAVALLVLPGSALAKKKHKKPKGLGPVVTATATGNTVTTPGLISTADAVCPSGLQAVGGGFLTPFDGSNSLSVTSSYRVSAGTWRASAVDAAGTGAVTSYAYCRRAKPAIAEFSNSAPLTSGFGHGALAEADCPPGVPAVSGGFETTTGPMPASAVTVESSAGGGPVAGGTPSVGYWDVAAQNNANGAQTVTAHVYCMSGIKVPALRQDQASATTPELWLAQPDLELPACPQAQEEEGQEEAEEAAGAAALGGRLLQPLHTWRDKRDSGAHREPHRGRRIRGQGRQRRTGWRSDRPEPGDVLLVTSRRASPRLRGCS